jgi:hypothetical protein
MVRQGGFGRGLVVLHLSVSLVSEAILGETVRGGTFGFGSKSGVDGTLVCCYITSRRPTEA